MRRAALLLLLARLASAQTLVLEAVPVGLPENVAAQLTGLVHGALTEKRPGAALPREALADVLSGAVPELERALTERLEAGRNAYFAGDEREAVRTLEPLLAELEKRLLVAPELEPILDCYRLLAASYAQQKRDEPIAPIVAALVRLRPEETPDGGLYPASLVRAFQRELGAV